jgi:phosphate transport system permease protein
MRGSLLDRVSAIIPSVALGGSALGVAVGCLSLSLNSLDAYRLIVAGLLAASLALLALHARYEDRVWDREVFVLLAATLLAAVVLARLPEYTYGHSINGLIHRSLFTALILLAVALPAFCAALYYLLGATPSARDLSRYPMIVLPIALALLAYGAILSRLVQKGWHDLTWHALSHAYSSQLTGTTIVNEAGMRNHILGTFLLIAMTAMIALPIGVGTGIFVSEYDGLLAKVVAFSTSMLRAISVFILAVSAFSLVRYATDHDTGTAISNLIRGSYLDSGGFSHPAKGSFLIASVFLSLLVIPVIARATEEGLRSIPRDIREGSVALGATEGHAMLRMLLPWTLPNIITGLLLGAAEAAGSVTVLLFISGSGQYGIGPRHEATSLAYLIFDAGRGTKSFTDVMGQYQFSAALLLLCITLSLTSAALVLKQRFARRYRSGISYQ